MQRRKTHRVHLLLLRPDGELGMHQSLGSAHGFFPSLWQVLLTDFVELPALQHIAGGSTRWIGSDAHSAISRYRELVALIAQHPAYAAVAGLDRYLHGAADFLEGALAQWRLAAAAAPCLCLDLERLPSHSPTGQPIDYTAQLRVFQQQLQVLMQSGDSGSIASLLHFPSRLLQFTDWRAWSGMFGLAQFEPHYFSAAFRQPFAECFADHDYDEYGSQAQIGENRFRIKRGTLWGVAIRSEASNEFVIEPEWDRILRSGREPSPLVWVQRDGRHALASSDNGRLLCEVTLDEVHGFDQAVAIVRVGDHYGLLNASGAWVLAPSLDDIHAFAYGLAVAKSNGRFGFIDPSGQTIIDMQFDEADDFSAAGVARVCSNRYCGLVRRDGTMALPLVFERIEWSIDFDGWLCERDGTVSLAHADGAIWSNGAWTAIEVLVRHLWIRVQQGTRRGLLSWQGELLLPCRFQELTLRCYTSLTPATAQVSRSRRWAQQKIKEALQPAGAAVSPQIVARRDARLGLFDEQLRLTVPFEFSRIEALEPHVEGEVHLDTTDLVRVMSLPGAAAPHAGIWSLSRQCLLVPCVYDYVWACLFDTTGRHGFIVGTRNPKRGHSSQGRYRVGVLRADGGELVPQRYAWIAESTALNRDDALLDIRSTLFHYWSQRVPVRASVNANGPLVSIDCEGVEHVLTGELLGSSAEHDSLPSD